MLRRFELTGVAGSVLLFATVSACAQMTGPSVPLEGARVAGVVRDARGVPQMGVMVELLGAGVAETALTDLEGRYVINARPGLYQMRASASLFLPVLRQQLRLRAGMKPIVNLTMSGLFDESAWLPVRQQTVGESAEDWKWTLKSPVSRPMLRLADDTADPGLDAAEHRHGESRALLLAGASSGGYGSSGEHGTVLFAHQSADGRTRSTVRTGLTGQTASAQGAPVRVSGLFETGAETPVERRVAVRMTTYPQIRDAEGHSLSAVAFSTAERMQMGDSLALEAGSETEVLKAGRSLVVAHPFLRVAAHPGAGWVMSYALASAPGMGSYEDVGASREDAPAFVSDGHRAATDAGVHQEIRVQRTVGRAKLQVSVHHDVQHRTAVGGVFAGKGASASGAGMVVPSSTAGVSVDESSGEFRSIVPGFSGGGCSLLAEVPVGEQLTVSGGYLTGVGLTLSSSDRAAFAAPKRGQAVLVSLQGRIAKTGTRVTTAYRWQPGTFLTVLSPYESSAPYLSLHVRQRVPHSALLPSGMEVTVDGSNVLAEGYQHASMIAPDALLASALRELRAGIAFTF